MKWILFTISLLVIGLLAGSGGLKMPLSISEAELPVKVEVDYLDSQPQYIKDLIQCESGGNWNAKVLDVNNRYSYGGLQFQSKTAWVYNEKYKVLPDLELNELPNVINDPYFQVELAKKILAENGGFKNWLVCAKMTGLNDLALKR